MHRTYKNFDAKQIFEIMLDLQIDQKNRHCASNSFVRLNFEVMLFLEDEYKKPENKKGLFPKCFNHLIQEHFLSEEASAQGRGCDGALEFLKWFKETFIEPLQEIESCKKKKD